MEERVQETTHLIAGDLDQASQPFVGRWNELISKTNWEKGRIIVQWREALIESGAPVMEYSDEAWSRRVGGVTGQHVGRLRRVFQRFGQVFQQYPGLYWSHFHAGLDWDDAEMWLEGGVQNQWSVSQMRRMRWETLGQGPEPRDEDVVAADQDEDYVPLSMQAEKPQADESPITIRGEFSEVNAGPRDEGPDFGDQDVDRAEPIARFQPETTAIFRPFADLPDLPDDLAEAFDAFKLAILHHKNDGWNEVACDDVLASLDALKQFALAPAEES